MVRANDVVEIRHSVGAESILTLGRVVRVVRGMAHVEYYPYRRSSAVFTARLSAELFESVGVRRSAEFRALANDLPQQDPACVFYQRQLAAANDPLRARVKHMTNPGLCRAIEKGTCATVA